MKRHALPLALLTSCLVAVAAFAAEPAPAAAPAAGKDDAAAKAAPAPAAPAAAEQKGPKIIEGKNPIVKVTTAKGDMLVELYEDKVPNTVANFISLAEKGFYKDMTFHRVIPGFMAQGGCPNSKPGARGMPGTGGPGYKFADEINPDLKHTGKGILSMANAGPNTNGSQFFLCFVETGFLDGKHAVFGKVVDGLDVLAKLEAIGTKSGKPTEVVSFNVVVVSKQGHPYEVKNKK